VADEVTANDPGRHGGLDPQIDAALSVAVERATAYLSGLRERPVRERATADELREALDLPLPDGPSDPAEVVRHLAGAAEPGVVATGSPRYFGFVIGGALPAALAADWLASAWDQNAGLYVGGPSAAVAEEVAGRWVLDLLGLPATASFGFVTGGQMANATALAAARHGVLSRVGWDVERRGLAGAPPLRVLAGDLRHATIDRALRFLGIGTDALEVVPTGADARLQVDALAAALAGAEQPTIVCAQAGEVNSGALDPIAEICEVARGARAWVHVDGAFGLWAAASPTRRRALAGVERADSWATDFHKWLNVPYDSGFVACADPAAHRGAMGTQAAYLVHAPDAGPRDQMDWNPEFSRRARGFAVYAALRSLGRQGVADLVERCCDRARQFADRLGEIDGVEVLNDVTLDQVLVRFRSPDGGDDRTHGAAAADAVAAGDATTRRVIDAVQASGECWMSGTTWRGRAAMRISVVNWQTTEADVGRSVAAIGAALAAVRAASLTPDT
jgi:glutamate/tyrosine decarboxylase-like PLP-dependent enzyme